MGVGEARDRGGGEDAVACLTKIYTMRAFDLILAMTGGGPLDSSNVLPLFSWQFTFQQFRFGIGATIGTFAFLIVFAVALAYVRTLNREAQAWAGARAGCRADGLAPPSP
jgi:multiple sugar transport system permease protein